MLVDVFHSESADVEAHTQIFRAQHVVHIGNGGEALGHQSPVKGVQTVYSMIVFRQIEFHESHIGTHVLEERSCERLAQYGYSQVRILLC